MTNSLPPDLSAFVTQSIATGKYATPDDVVEAGLRLLQEREQYDEHLARELQKGIDDLENGRYIEFKDAAAIHQFFDEKQKRLHAKFADKSTS
jgi:putative addiction module CopG family antidote